VTAQSALAEFMDSALPASNRAFYRLTPAR
jgi:hypothetical protein